jgi:sulfonate transport system permease protein
MPAPSDIALTLRDLAEVPCGSTSRQPVARLARASPSAPAWPWYCRLGRLSRASEALEPTFAGLRSIPAWPGYRCCCCGWDRRDFENCPDCHRRVLSGVLNGVAAIRNIDRKLVEVGQMYGFSHRRLVR